MATEGGLPFTVWNGFARSPEDGGNAAGVVVVTSPHSSLDAVAWNREVSSDDQLQLAKLLGYSETVFLRRVESDGDGDGDGELPLALSYVTPEGEVDLCGHATIATLGMMFARGGGREPLRVKLHTKAGVLAAGVDARGVCMMAQAPPAAPETLAVERVAAVLDGVDPDVLLGCWICSTGLRDIFLEVATEDALASLKPDMPALAALSVDLDVTGLHAFCWRDGGLDRFKAGEDGSDAAHVVARNFAPRFGIDEEAATGTANCALGCLLATLHPDAGRASSGADEASSRHVRLVVAQGVLPMKQESLIFAEVDVKGESFAPRVGGCARPVRTGCVRRSVSGWVEVPDPAATS